MLKIIQINILVLACICVPMLSRAEDLMEIYQVARQSDPTLAAADAQKNSVHEGIDQARAALLPQISASLGYIHNDTGSNTLSPEVDASGNFVLLPIQSTIKDRERDNQAQLTQSLFNWGNITRLKSSKAQAAGADSDYQTALQGLLIRVATAYFGVLTADDQLTFAQANEKALARQLDQAEQRFEVGLSAITDVHEARANHDAAVAQVILAQNNVDNARESVVALTNQPIGDLKRLRDQLPLNKPEPDNLQAWVDTAMQNSPSLASSQHAVDAAEYTIATARSGHYPTLNASIARTDTPAWGNENDIAAGINSGNFRSNSLTGVTTIGVTLNVPLFTGGLVSSQVRQAVFNRDAAQDQYELQRRNSVLQTRNAYRAVIAGISEVDATKQAVVSAQSALDATQAGFEVGTRTIVDVLLSQQQLFQAQSTYSQARHQFVLSGLLLKQSAGVIEAKDLQAVNALLE